MPPPDRPAGPDSGSAREVLGAFLVLGLTSFGGPVAHLGYFRNAFVVRRRWLTERAYADLVALCQFLPGPASSQVGMAIGLRRAGLRGMGAAWAGFTLPSAIALVAFGYALAQGGGDTSWIAGLKAAAVAVVAHALVGMARMLTPDVPRALLALAATAVALAVAGVAGQVLVILGAGVVGLCWLRIPPGTGEAGAAGADTAVRVRRRTAIGCLTAFAILLGALPAAATALDHAGVELFDSFYRAGSLVFGGGHVVLPLLESGTVRSGLVDQEVFLAGYGAAQAVPGPLFTFAAYLGSVAQAGPTGALGATIALVAIYLPSALLVVGALPFWERLREAPRARRALMGVNAGVVGLLAAALIDPVLTAGVTSWRTGLVAAAAYVGLVARLPPWSVVVSAGLLGLFALPG